MQTNVTKALEWLKQNPDRRLELSHGGDGGLWYAKLVDEDGDSWADGAAITWEDAVAECGSGIVEGTP